MFYFILLLRIEIWFSCWFVEQAIAIESEEVRGDERKLLAEGWRTRRRFKSEDWIGWKFNENRRKAGEPKWSSPEKFDSTENQSLNESNASSHNKARQQKFLAREKRESKSSNANRIWSDRLEVRLEVENFTHFQASFW